MKTYLVIHIIYIYTNLLLFTLYFIITYKVEYSLTPPPMPYPLTSNNSIITVNNVNTLTNICTFDKVTDTCKSPSIVSHHSSDSTDNSISNNLKPTNKVNKIASRLEALRGNA